MKAFDNVWRAGLWRKISTCGISGKVLKVIYMYDNIKSCVSSGGSKSSFFCCEQVSLLRRKCIASAFLYFNKYAESYLGSLAGQGV